MAFRTAALQRRRRLSWMLVAAAWLALPARSDAPGGMPVPSVATEFAQCKHFFPAGLPPMVPEAAQLRELCFDGFAVLHSGQTKTPVFVVEYLDRLVVRRAARVPRGDDYHAEPRLPGEERAEVDDYHQSGYSMGHMAPAGDMGTEQAKVQSFSLANMAPQDAQLNHGVWNDIEQDTRRYVRRAQAGVYVFTGPAHSDADHTIGAGGVQVPRYFYKLVYDPSNGRSWAHWQPNAPWSRRDEPIDYEELVRRTGIEFVPR